MAEDSGLFGGSVDRSKLEEMKAAAGDDPERQRQVAEVQAQVDAAAALDAAAEQARQQAAAETAPEPAEQPAQESAPTQSEPSEDLSALTKTELVDRANAAGIDTYGKNKAELIEELNRQGG